MRFIVMVKATKDSEAGEMPSEELLGAMAKFNEEMVKAGVMLDGNGLPLATLITPGQAGDSPMFLSLMAHPRVGREKGRPRTRPAGHRTLRPRPPALPVRRHARKGPVR